jgi:ketosteroid isomerase-like protein
MVTGGIAMNRESMLAFIKQAYAARDGGNVAGVVDAFHGDGVFELAGSRSALVLTGAVEGHPDLKAAMKDFTETFEFSGREIISVIAEGDRAAVHSRLTVLFKPKTRRFTTDILDLFTFKDGKISELVEFADTAMIKEVAFA